FASLVVSPTYVPVFELHSDQFGYVSAAIERQPMPLARRDFHDSEIMRSYSEIKSQVCMSYPQCGCSAVGDGDAHQRMHPDAGMFPVRQIDYLLSGVVRLPALRVKGRVGIGLKQFNPVAVGIQGGAWVI